jgi:spore coat polysaccharide biosynthesis protein SpsF (cytidylyltransferase family)
MTKQVAIVQARMTSTRLPGKVLMDLNGHTVLWHVLSRCKSIPSIAEVWCAVPKGGEHDQVAIEALAAGALVLRGSETDVLKRYADVVRESGADVILRVTSDCPLISPEVCEGVLSLLSSANADYACNNMPPSWPHGLDCEAFTAETLFTADSNAEDQFSREHVTPWIRNNDKFVKANLHCSLEGVSSIRMTLDYAEDYKFFVDLFRHLGASADTAELSEILQVLQEFPSIQMLNHYRADSTR